MFVDYLKEKYPDINEFNREFGLDYWSNRVNTWEDFPDVRGTINESLAAEFAKFQRLLVTRFLTWQASIVSGYKRPDQFITQNFDFDWTDHSIGYQPEVNQYEAARCMTVAGCDIYHPSQSLLTAQLKERQLPCFRDTGSGKYCMASISGAAQASGLQPHCKRLQQCHVLALALDPQCD